MTCARVPVLSSINVPLASKENEKDSRMTDNGKQPKYREIQGELNAAGLRFALIVSRFNSFITDRLLDGAMDALQRSGASADDIDVVRVPGAFEIPVAAKHLAESGRYNAVVCLGTVIRGDTT